MTAPNARPCGACRHQDPEALASGVAYCWRFYTWRGLDEVVVDCPAAERPNGDAPPGKLFFAGQRSRR